MIAADFAKIEARTMAHAVEQYGSQRNAAAALGISLGKLQRGLKAGL